MAETRRIEYPRWREGFQIGKDTDLHPEREFNLFIQGLAGKQWIVEGILFPLPFRRDFLGVNQNIPSHEHCANLGAYKPWDVDKPFIARVVG